MITAYHIAAHGRTVQCRKVCVAQDVRAQRCRAGLQQSLTMIQVRTRMDGRCPTSLHFMLARRPQAYQGLEQTSRHSTLMTSDICSIHMQH